MRKLFSHSIIKIVAILSLTPLVQAAQFHLPPGTPGRQEIQKPTGNIAFQVAFKKIKNTIAFCEHVIVPGTTCHLYFPIDGSQPTTVETGEYSGARFVGQPGDDLVTDWWVRVFGGNRAVELSNRRGALAVETAVLMGFDNATNTSVHIMRVNTTLTGTPANFEQNFWEAFRTIAADPVGRVLLYRLLIEIRRLDDAGRNGCCEYGISTPRGRNNLRNIKIRYSNIGFCFKSSSRYIAFDPQDIDTNTMTFNLERNEVATAKDAIQDTLDIGLFHEMLHWFHFLQHLRRYDKSNSENPAEYRYLLRSYYGDLSEIYTWASVDDEELRTILGAPNYKDKNQRDLIHPDTFYNALPINGIKVVDTIFLPVEGLFLNGDDLSENAYRLSRNQHRQICHMRFGHGAAINPCPLKNRFRLANLVAKTCYSNITGIQINNILWDIGNGATQ